MALGFQSGLSVFDLLVIDLTTDPHKQIVDTAMVLQALRLCKRLPGIQVLQASLEPNRHKLAHA